MTTSHPIELDVNFDLLNRRFVAFTKAHLAEAEAEMRQSGLDAPTREAALEAITAQFLVVRANLYADIAGKVSGFYLGRAQQDRANAEACLGKQSQ